MVRAMLLPPAGQAHSPGLIHVLDLLERHCLAPDGSLLVNSTYQDLLLVRVLAINWDLLSMKYISDG